MKEEKDKEIDSLVQTVSEWVALATDRKQDVDQLKAEAKEKDERIKELENGGKHFLRNVCALDGSELMSSISMFNKLLNK